MRHSVKGRKLGRTVSHRKATMQALSVALLEHEKITTTLPKAKELRRYVEPIITRSKNDTLHNRREAFSFLRKKEVVTKLFEEIGPLVADRPGGYTRIIKLGQRQGDGAEVALVELVDYNDVQPESPSKAKKTRRSGGSRKRKKSSTDKKAETTAATSKAPEAKEAATDSAETKIENTDASSEVDNTSDEASKDKE